LEVSPNLLQRWRQEFDESPGRAFPGAGRRLVPDRVAQLEPKIGQQRLEIDFWKGCLLRIERQGQLHAVMAKRLSTARSKSREEERQGQLQGVMA
jgi:transposase-like protein